MNPTNMLVHKILLLHDLHCRVCESQLSYMNANATVMLLPSKIKTVAEKLFRYLYAVLPYVTGTLGNFHLNSK